MLSDTALRNIQACLSSLDELAEGKFIFAENIIKKILTNISQSDEIFDLISECMKNFNFDREFNRAKVKMPTKDGYFNMPENRAVIIPMVFCILVDIRDRKLDFGEFLKNYFKHEKMSEYENFAQVVIAPFKQALLYCFDMENQGGQVHIEDLQKQEQQKQEKVQKENNRIQKQEEIKQQIQQKSEETIKLEAFFENIKNICNQITCIINQERKIKPEIKDDCEYVIRCIIDNVEKQDINNITALIVAGEYVFGKVKHLRFVAKELREQIISLYN